MLRIDETSKTLVAPEPTEFVPDGAPDRDELLALLSGGWSAFAAEIGQPSLSLVGAPPEPGVDMLAIDEAAGRVVAVTVGNDSAVSRALHSAAVVASWDADKLGAMHESLQTATPGDSPRMVIVGAEMDPASLMTMDFLSRSHDLEMTAYGVRTLRRGSERMLEINRLYPAPDPEFTAKVADTSNSAPPPPPPPPPPAPVQAEAAQSA